MGQPSTSFGQPQRSRNPHQNLYIPKAIFKTPVQLGRLPQMQQLKPRKNNFSVTGSLAADPLEASHSGIRAAAGWTSAPLVSSRPTAVWHAPADLPPLQRFIMKKQLEQEQRAQYESQIRTLAEPGHDAASLSVLAAEDLERSSDEQSEQGITDVPMADWEDLPADHRYVQDSDYQMLSAPPSPTSVDAAPSAPPSFTAVDAAPSAAAIMGTDALVANVTAPDTVHAEVAAVELTVAVSPSTGADTLLSDVAAAATTAAEAFHADVAIPITTAAEAVHDNLAAPITTAAEAVHDDVAAPVTTAAEAVHDDVAAPITTAAEAVHDDAATPITIAAEASCADVAPPTTTAAATVPITVVAGDTSSTDAQHADTLRTTAAIDTSAAAPLAVDMEAVLAQQSEKASLERQQNQLRAAAQVSEAADAAAGSGFGGYESSHGGGHRADNKSSLTEGHMASAAVTGGSGHMQQASEKPVGHGFAEPSKMGIGPSASLPGPLGQASPSTSLPFPLLPLGGGMGSHGPPAFPLGPFSLLPFGGGTGSHGPPPFIPMSAAAIAASVEAKQEEVARKVRHAQRVAEKAAQEAAALQRVLGGKQT